MLLIGRNGSYTAAQEIPIVVLTLALYAFFLVRQIGAQAAEFREVDTRLDSSETSTSTGSAAGRLSVRQIVTEHRYELILRLALLVVTVLPIVLLAPYMATLLDDGLGRLGVPAALAGILIAMIVFLPESITSVRAAMQGEIQRVSNLCHGALVSTVGLTIPAVLIIGLLTGQTVVLGESPANLLLLGVTLLLSVVTFTAPKVTATHGAAHLVVFATYGIVVVS